MIDRLFNRSGSVRELLGVPDDGKTIELSGLGWEGRYAVVCGVRFERVRIADARVSVNFVECICEQSEFVGLNSHSHFWAAGSTWKRCAFKDLRLVDMIAPQNRFIDCEFLEVSIQGMSLCQTLYDNCRFVDCAIQGLVSRRVGIQSLQLPEVAQAGASALFRDCQFRGGSFAGCSFSDVGFARCAVSGTQFVHCNFQNVAGPDRWWREFESGDPFNLFLSTVLQGIEGRLGRESRAFVELAAYAEDYRLQRTTSKDYSACLYAADVPDNELDAIQEILDRAEASFPM